MSQNDFNIANQGFPATRADINSALQALASNSAGTAEPSTTYAYQFWYDETNELLKMRNSDNDAWITIGTFDQTGDTFTPAGVTTDKIEEGNSSVEVVDTGTGYVAITVDGVEAARVDANGRLGIGATSPVTSAHIVAPSGNFNTTYNDFDGVNILLAGNGTNGNGNYGNGIAWTIASGAQSEKMAAIASHQDQNDANRVGLAFFTHTTSSGGDPLVEAMRIDSSGNLLVGSTSASNATVGARLKASGRGDFTANGGLVSILNRLTSDGEILRFEKDGSTVGSIGSNGDRLYMATDSNTGVAIDASSNIFFPCTDTGDINDNVMDLGVSSSRWDDVYATNGTIQTSDRNEKQDIEELTDAEQRVAVAAKGLLRKYRWKDAVAEKGDAARIHFGIIAQDLQAAFEAEGLDAGRYGMFISSTWWEADRVIPAVEAQDAVYETVVIPAEYDADGNEISPETTEERLVSEAVEAQPERTVTDTYETQEEAPEGAVERTRMGVRYPELLAFIIAVI